MLGRPQLERVARETDLDLRARDDEERESLLNDLRDKIGIATGRADQSRNLYSITFEDRDRAMAVAVVQTLLDTFVEDVLELKEQGIEDVEGYLKEQLAHYSGLLSTAESELAGFKKQNVGLLPGDNGGVFQRLQTELDALKLLRIDLQTEIDRREELRRQLSSANSQLPPGSENSLGVLVPTTATESAIADLEARRSSLLLTFTERHPDINAINEQLEQLYVKRRNEQASLSSSGTGLEGAANATNPVYQTTQIALNEANVRIAGLRSQVTQRDMSAQHLRLQIDTIPEIEAEYTRLTRDYAQFQSLYDELLEQKERERMGAVGDNRDVVSFNVVEPPASGVEPVAPARGILILMVLAMGIGAGAGVAYLFHLFNPVFVDAETLRRVSMRPVLGVVSKTWLDRGRVVRRVNSSSFAVAGIGLVCVFVFSVLFQDYAAAFIQTIVGQLLG
jgi:polysaccharide chain length determinant protein (PEP-CTERM system associated)